MKFVALSFDDGPNTVTTPKVLDVLRENGVKASFFVIGNKIDKKSAAVMKRASEMGCDIENHSYTHSHMTQMSEADIKDEVAKTSALVQKYTGRAPQFFRPPYIDVNDLMYNSIDLTFICGVGCEDWVKEVTADMRAQRILDSVKDGDIILMHDAEGNDQTVEALKKIIPALKDRGFRFVTVPELFEVRGALPKPHDGKVYTNIY